MDLELFDSSGTEGITSREHDRKVVIFKHISDFGKSGRFSDTIDPNKYDYKGLVFFFFLKSHREQVYVLFRGQDFGETLFNRFFDQIVDRCENWCFVGFEFFLDVIANLRGDFFGDVFFDKLCFVLV